VNVGDVEAAGGVGAVGGEYLLDPPIVGHQPAEHHARAWVDLMDGLVDVREHPGVLLRGARPRPRPIGLVDDLVVVDVALGVRGDCPDQLGIGSGLVGAALPVGCRRLSGGLAVSQPVGRGRDVGEHPQMLDGGQPHVLVHSGEVGRRSGRAVDGGQV
jgi:hypothetical protein